VSNRKLEVQEILELGAFDYLSLPPNPQIISTILKSIVNDDQKLISKSQNMQKVILLVDKVAKSDATILVTGESGTGKEIISRHIHAKSNRAAKNFIAINCAAIPENLLESELFGHEKGAFTGAIAKRIGKFEEANGGTLLLDEISEIDLHLQAKLLRVIQEKEITRIGGSGKVKTDVRIIATSNRELKKYVEQGKFREDLFYRLNVININLPSLREREEDIIEIANFYINKYAKQNNIEVPQLSIAAIDKMLSYAWPGNVRELENTMYRAVLLCNQKCITPEDLMINQMNYDEINKDKVHNALNKSLGDRIEAAKILGVSLKILQKKLNEIEVQ
jgi:transcriptional regulator with PAS, ATPase and Fis domain